MPDIDNPGHLNNLSAQQQGSLNAFWRIILQYPKPSLLDEFWIQLAIDNADALLLRYLRARKWNIEAACTMFLQALEWRRSFQVQQLMRQGEAAVLLPLLESGKGFFWGEDREGRLVAYFRPRLHDWRAQSTADTCRHIVFQTEISRRLFPPGNETLTVVFDMQGLTAWSLDLGCMRFVVSCFQEHYPESLGPCLIVNAPWIFFSFYGIVKGWLCEEVRAKIRFLNDYSQLKEYIAPEMLLVEYGGEHPYHYEYFSSPLKSSLHDLEELTGLEIMAKEKPLELIRKGERDEKLISELSKLYIKIDALCMPQNLYHRIGVLRPGEKTPNWQK